MALTFTQLTPAVLLWQEGNVKECLIDIGLDSSYVTNGYSIPNSQAGVFGMLQVLSMEQVGINGPSSSTEVRWDRANNKLLVIQTQPQSMIVEEVVTITANTGRLANVPAYILAAHQSAGTTTGAAKVVPTGSTLGTKQVDVNFTSGAVKTFATDAVTTLLVTYIPMGVGPFIPANQVVDESVTFLNATAPALASQASLVQYVYDTQGASASAKALQVIRNGTAPSGTQVAIKLDDTGATTTINTPAGLDAHVGKVTYWKRSALGVAFGYTAQANVAATSNAISYSSVTKTPGLLIPCYGVAHVGVTVAPADIQEIALGPSGAVAANVCVINPALDKISFNSADAVVNEELAYIILANEMLGMTAGGSGIQVPAGMNLSAYTIRMRVLGR